MLICILSPPLFCNTSATGPLFPDNQVDLVFNVPTVPRLALCLDESLRREKDLGELPAVLTGRTQYLHMHNGCARRAGPPHSNIQLCELQAFIKGKLATDSASLMFSGSSLNDFFKHL